MILLLLWVREIVIKRRMWSTISPLYFLPVSCFMNQHTFLSFFTTFSSSPPFFSLSIPPSFLLFLSFSLSVCPALSLLLFFPFFPYTHVNLFKLSLSHTHTHTHTKSTYIHFVHHLIHLPFFLLFLHPNHYLHLHPLPYFPIHLSILHLSTHLSQLTYCHLINKFAYRTAAYLWQMYILYSQHKKKKTRNISVYYHGNRFLHSSLLIVIYIVLSNLW